MYSLARDRCSSESGIKKAGEEQTLGNMRAVMICFDRSCRVGGIHMECIQMGTDALHRPEVLDDSGGGFEHTAFGGELVTGRFFCCHSVSGLYERIEYRRIDYRRYSNFYPRTGYINLDVLQKKDGCVGVDTADVTVISRPHNASVYYHDYYVNKLLVR